METEYDIYGEPVEPDEFTQELMDFFDSFGKSDGNDFSITVKKF